MIYAKECMEYTKEQKYSGIYATHCRNKALIESQNQSKMSPHPHVLSKLVSFRMTFRDTEKP